MKHKKNLPYLSVDDLQAFNSSLYHVFFDLKNFQRKYRKYFKFSILYEHSFSMHFKSSKHGLRVVILPDNYFQITSTKHAHIYELCCLNQRDLIAKIISNNLI